MSYYDPEIYNIENLKDEDRQYLSELEYIKENILCDETVDEYLSEFGYGKTASAILAELFIPFIHRLSEDVDLHIQELIVGMIDNYSDEEFERLKKERENGNHVR